MKTVQLLNFFKRFLFGLILTALFTACSKEIKEQPINTGSSDLASAAARPNIILIVADDVGREIPRYSGGESYETPNLDFLAANGKEFSNFCAHPDGPPSRIALVTGKYSYRNWEKFGYLSPGSLTFANMLRDKGYATCFTGKWQYDGGDASIKSHGFNKYLVFQPFNPDLNNGHDQYYRRYKNPYLYKEAKWLSDAEVKNKYSEDMFFDYASKFIDSNKNKPFLLVYSNNLVQKPWSPSPDHPDYATWNPAVDDEARDDKSYFPSMVKYLDKMVGKLVSKVNSAGIAQKTIIIFTSDNATNKDIRSLYNGKMIRGGKGKTTNSDINVPLLAYSPGKITPGKDTSLVDMTDFFPTFAEIAAASKTPYLPLDGISFYDNLTGTITAAKQRKNVYCYWPREYQKEIDLSYVLDYNYKLYDSLNGGAFYNTRLDPTEQTPIPNNQLTDAEKKIKNRFKVILRQAF